MKLSLFLVVLALLVPVLALGAPKVIKYAHFQPAKLDQPKQAAALAFKNYVEANTKGSVKVEIYPASQLGNAITVLEGLKLGTIEMAVVHDGPISPVFKPFMVYAIPYLFDDQAMAWSVVDGPFGDKLAEAMRKATGIRMFALADNGIRSFTNSKRVITSPSDMKGMKIRVMRASGSPPAGCGRRSGKRGDQHSGRQPLSESEVHLTGRPRLQLARLSDER
jgi:C4-dicarboxylate-binding protein DctP